MDDLIDNTWGFKDARLFEGAIALAQNPGALERSRVEALRILYGMINPELYVSYEEITHPSDAFSVDLDVPARTGEPLPPDYLTRILDAMMRIGGDAASPPDVRTAAELVASAARACRTSTTCTSR